MKRKQLDRNRLHKVKCRKEHCCEHCGKKILVGEEAFRVNLRETGPKYWCEKCNKNNKEELLQSLFDEEDNDTLDPAWWTNENYDGVGE